ncbi:F0F1-type ATP synthase delta subunit [Cytobacillus horneckiae]|uniref:Uncharacterized protein n=1 Tax=Cytobacillus horneckiae TaxID=549687 RepID=A0A2N0ZJF1_9BACI|nr:hypothetical protein [Cytobacillus horneckiae]MBN6888684.1 hypothetical protein [Cytobacillus horneckiae]MCM3180590.1 hypothetical protein [Cytobacillus horneckiae]MEC1154035.1 hypothetical protein [Cytobacillus horneckiae]MED2938610.1 hypothetical protein [Cytobacillus horneckiae]PKG29660.1 hypothetical protein CWS20_07270 [Cytobacillus horneckiae]
MQSVNQLSENCESLEEIETEAKHLNQFLPHLDIMNMKATLLDLFVNDLNYQSINLLVVALSSNKQLSHLQNFIQPINHWVSVIKSREQVLAV